MKFPFFQKKKKQVEPEGLTISLTYPSLDMRQAPPEDMVDVYTRFIAQELPGAPSLKQVRKDFASQSIWEQHQTLQSVHKLILQVIPHLEGMQNHQPNEMKG